MWRWTILGPQGSDAVLEDIVGDSPLLHQVVGICESSGRNPPGPLGIIARTGTGLGECNTVL